MIQMLFRPEGKNPYYRGGMAIHNLDDLQRSIDMFDNHEAPWVADWLDYLGDAQLAQKIRREPALFKKLVCARWDELTMRG